MRIYKSFFRFEKCRKACKYRLYRLMRTYKEIVKNYILIYITSFKALIQVLNILLTIFSGESGSNVGVICLDIILLSSTIPTAIFFHLNLYRFYTFLFLTVNHCNIRVQLKYGSRNFRCYRSRKCLFKYFFLSFAICN